MWCEPDTPFLVMCESCKASVKDYATEAEAIEAWNRRVATDKNVVDKERTAKVEKVTRVSSVIRTGRCGDCGYDVIDSYKHYPNCGAKLDWSE